MSIRRVVVERDLPPGTITTARERVAPHLEHLAMATWSLETLAVNCYLQGARDMAETLIAQTLEEKT